MSLRLLIHTITQYSITARRCANRMILRSCCFLGTLHRGRARKALRASWGPSTTTVSTHMRTIYAHTHAQAQAHMAWRRVDSQRGPDTITSLQRHHCHCGGSHLHLTCPGLTQTWTALPRRLERIPTLQRTHTHTHQRGERQNQGNAAPQGEIDCVNTPTSSQ